MYVYNETNEPRTEEGIAAISGKGNFTLKKAEETQKQTETI